MAKIYSNNSQTDTPGHQHFSEAQIQGIAHFLPITIFHIDITTKHRVVPVMNRHNVPSTRKQRSGRGGRNQV